MGKDQAEHLHSGHRTRMRERFLHAGGDTLADHELLEMLLYYALPRRDTNALAHCLMEEFGSLSGVLEADTDLLCRVDGLGESSATYLKLLGELSKRYIIEKMTDSSKKAVFDTPEKIATFMAPRYMGINIERVYLLLFDNGLHMIDCFHVCDGSVSSVSMSVRRIAEQAFKKGAAAAILTHNHPGGRVTPSSDDVRVTRHLQEALAVLEIPLLEHYVFAGRDYAPVISFACVQQQEAYAASSLFDLLRQRMAAFHRKENNRNEGRS